MAKITKMVKNGTKMVPKWFIGTKMVKNGKKDKNGQKWQI